MNDIGPTGGELRSGPAEYREGMDNCVRRHPESAVMAALLGGLFIGFVVLLLRPQPTARSRTMRLLDDMQHQVRDLANLGVKRVKKGIHRSEGKLEGMMHGVSRRWHRFLS